MRPLAASSLRQIQSSAPGLGLLIGFCALSLASCDLLFGPDVGGYSSAVDVPPPPPGTVHAIDISAGTGEITAEDIACWRREYGAEHVIVAFNWQESNLALALRQLEIVVASGVTLDAYVWVAWTDSQRPLGPERVETVLSLVSDYPVRRLWLDVESHRSGSDSELDSAQRLPILRAAVAACGGFPCGIYTRKNWWNAEIGQTTEFNELPLWYARYDHQPNFQDWHNFPAENPDLGPFGGWSSPTGKQYDSDESVAAERADLCTNSEIDWSVMKVPGANDEDPPPAPTGLRPNGVTVTESPVTVRWDAISDATEYQLEVEYRDGGSWTPYWTERRTTNSFEFPLGPETSYRFKVSAKNSYDWGLFSDWASFEFVKPGAPPPPPTNLQPNTVNITTSPVTLSVNPIPGVIEYEFHIDYRKNDAWVYYYTYQSDTNTQTFWPQVEGTSYRWLARARNQSGWGEWSYDAVFWFNP